MDVMLSWFPSYLSGSSLVSFVAPVLYQIKCLNTLLPPQTLGLLSSLHTPSLRDLIHTHGLVVCLHSEDSQISISSSDIPWGSRLEYLGGYLTSSLESLMVTSIIECLRLNLISPHLPVPTFPLLFAILVKGNSMNLTAQAKAIESH